jgi:predicted Zn-dependent protease
MPSANEIYEEAVALKEAGKIEEAVAMLEGLIENEPDHVLAHTGLSVFYGKLDRHEEAVKHARKVCELDPDDPFSHIAMSTICQKAGQIQEAEQAMKVAMEKQWSGQK